MKRKLDRHDLKLNRVKQTVAYINRALEKYPEDSCRLYYDCSLSYVLPVDRTTQPELYKDAGNIYICEKHFDKPVTIQDIYDIMDEHRDKLEAYRQKQGTIPRRHMLLVNQEEWEYLVKALEEYRNKTSVN